MYDFNRHLSDEVVEQTHICMIIYALWTIVNTIFISIFVSKESTSTNWVVLCFMLS